MEAQVCVEISGGIAEAIFLGTCEAWRSHCSDADLERAADVCRELRRLTGYAFRAEDFAERTLTMLLANWPSVDGTGGGTGRTPAHRGRKYVEAIIDAA